MKLYQFTRTLTYRSNEKEGIDLARENRLVKEFQAFAHHGSHDQYHYEMRTTITEKITKTRKVEHDIEPFEFVTRKAQDL